MNLIFSVYILLLIVSIYLPLTFFYWNVKAFLLLVIDFVFFQNIKVENISTLKVFFLSDIVVCNS
jgi:hypothetical protein